MQAHKPIRGTLLKQPDGSPAGRLAASILFACLLNEGTGTIVTDIQGRRTLNFGAGGAAPAWAAGNKGLAVSFDGGDNINGPTLGAMSLPLTIVASFKREGAGVWDPVFASHDFNNTYYGIALSVRNTTNVVWLQYGSGTGNGSGDRRTKEGSTALSAGTWYQIAGVIRGAGDMDIYIDAVDDGGSYSGTSGAMSTASGLPKIGVWLGPTADQNLTGDVEYVYLFDTALSLPEVKLLSREPFCIFAAARVPVVVPTVTVAGTHQRHIGFRPVEGAERLRNLLRAG